MERNADGTFAEDHYCKWHSDEDDCQDCGECIECGMCDCGDGYEICEDDDYA